MLSSKLDVNAGCFFPLSKTLRADQKLSHNSHEGSRPLCRFFRDGACRRGLDCQFSHDLSNLTQSCNAILLQKDLGNTNDGSDKSKSNNEEIHVVDNGISCHFGPGMQILQLRLGPHEEDHTSSKTSRKLLISGISSDISDYDLEARLSVFGTILDIQRKQQHYAFCEYGSSESAKKALSALNGTPQASWSGVMDKRLAAKGSSDTNKTTFVSLSFVPSRGSPTNRNASIKLQWYAPSRIAWVHFLHSYHAEKVARLCKGKIFDGRLVTAKFQRPTYQQYSSFSVSIGGLGEFVDEKQLKQFIRKHSGIAPNSVRLEDSPFQDKDGAKIIQKLLISQGKQLIQFDEDPNNHLASHCLKRKALAKFASADDAAQACKYFQKTQRIKHLGGTRVNAQRIFSFKFTLPEYVFVVIQDELREQIRKITTKTAKQVRFRIFNNQNHTTSVTCNTDDANTLACVRGQIAPVVDGEVLLDQCCKEDQKVPLWKDFFASKDVFNTITAKMTAKFGQNNVVVLLDKRRKQTLFFSRLSIRNDARAFALDELTHYKPSSLAVPITSDQFTFIFNGGRQFLDKLSAASYNSLVSIDIKNRGLLVAGGLNDAKRALACLQKFMSSNEESSPENPCPVCFCEPGEGDEGGSVQLSCTHKYCKECFNSWLCSGSQTCTFPVTCLSEDCGKGLALEELCKLLSRPNFLSLMRAAVDNHVMTNLSHYQFCITPGCSGIYSIPPDPTGRISCCSTCNVSICCHCKIQEHDGLTCEQHKLALLPPDQLRNHIVEEILTLKCPRCSQAFLDFSGCFALTCSACSCGFCGWCLKDCGRDAHSHVKSCPEKLPEARNETYFGTREHFEKVQRLSRRKKLIDFLRTLENAEDQRRVLEAIQRDLKDIGLSDVTLQSL